MTNWFVCPKCRQDLVSSANWLTCVACQAQFPITLGIPDLRYPRKATDEREFAMVAQLLSRYPQANFKGLLDIRLKNAPTYSELQEHHLTYMLDQKDRGPAMIGMFLTHWNRHFGQGVRGLALDLGCGLGPSLLTLAGKYQRVVGLDPSLPDLILAKKLLESSGILNVQLVQAQGQCLPFPHESIDKVFALNVLEHFNDLESVLHECFRVLRQGGGFVADSRNRYDLFFPEPHVKIRWVGLLPRRWAKSYVRWRRGMTYDATRLLSLAELKRGLRNQFGRNFLILFSDPKAYGAPSWGDRYLRIIKKIPGLRGVILSIFPSHLVVAKK